MRNLSFFEALLHMFKGSIGPGVLSLPYALSQSGICFLPVVLCLQAACAYCMLLMVRMKQDLESRPATAHVSSYGDVAAVALGGGLGRGVVDGFVAKQRPRQEAGHFSGTARLLCVQALVIRVQVLAVEDGHSIVGTA